MNRIFKITGLLEGISAILLFFVAVPMKYLFNDKSLIRPIGMAHGVLFTVFILLAVILMIQQKWNWKKFLIICVCAVIPLGTFYVDKKYLKDV
jgi:integral membrane protein